MTDTAPEATREKLVKKLLRVLLALMPWRSVPVPSEAEIVDVEFILKRAIGVVDRIAPPYSADKKDGAEWMKKSALHALEKLRRELSSRMGKS